MTTEDYLHKEILQTAEAIYKRTITMKLHNRDKEYPQFWCDKKAMYRYFDRNKAYVLFLDGKDVTKNHSKYNLTEEYGYTYKLHKAAIDLMNQYEISCAIYTGMDEISIIFADINQLSMIFNESDCIDNVMQIIQQKLVKALYKEEIDTEIRGCMFPINQDEIDEYIEYRKKIIHDLGLTYYAKDKMSSVMYHNLSNKEILENLKEAGLYNDFIHKKFLYEGYFCNLHFSNTYQNALWSY